MEYNELLILIQESLDDTQLPVINMMWLHGFFEDNNFVDVTIFLKFCKIQISGKVSL